ncbi:hypothetical protein [Litoreibacter arenae]|nr:hypothetical protein [Litoreibacter arenae]
MFIGLASGKLERGQVYTGLAATLASHITSSPALMALIPGTVPTQVADDSLQALKHRQRQVASNSDVPTGG